MNEKYLEGNELLVQAFRAANAEESIEHFHAVVDALQTRMLADGHLLLPVVHPEGNEEQFILRTLKSDKGFKIALCVEGKQYDSVALAQLIDEGCAKSGKLALVIGSSHGLSEQVKRACDVRLSVSKLTFPHQLMRLMLTEILYRSLTITAGKRYHK